MADMHHDSVNVRSASGISPGVKGPPTAGRKSSSHPAASKASSAKTATRNVAILTGAARSHRTVTRHWITI